MEDDEHIDEEETSQLRAQYPSLSDDQIGDAKDNLERYARVLLRMGRRIASDPVALAKFCKETGIRPRLGGGEEGLPGEKLESAGRFSEGSWQSHPGRRPVDY